MFSRHLGLKIFLLAGIAGQAELLEWLTRRGEPGWSIGLAVIIGSILAVLGGEWIVDEAVQRRWRRLGWGIAAGGAIVHLALDLACVSLAWLPVRHPSWLLAGVAIAAMVMIIQLVLAVRGLRNPSAVPRPGTAPARGFLGAVAREASLFGGTPIAVVTVSLGLVVLAAVGLAKRGWDDGVVKAAVFFGVCGLVGVCMGVERRAALLGRPVPWARWLPRLRRLKYRAAREGLLLVGRKETVLYRWNCVAGVSLGEMYGNPVVMVGLAPGTAGERIRATDSTPEGEARWRRRQLRGQSIVQALQGAELVIMSMHTLSGPGPLHAQIAAVIEDPANARSLPAMTDLLIQ